MSDHNAAITVLREMVRADLELAFDHLNNDHEELAAHEIRNALEKVTQMQELRRSDARRPNAATQQPLITLEHDETPTTGTDPKING